LRRTDGSTGMIRTCHERHEEADDLVAHELVDQTVVMEQHLSGRGVEAHVRAW
jgi:hypothetical protein